MKIIFSIVHYRGTKISRQWEKCEVTHLLRLEKRGFRSGQGRLWGGERFVGFGVGVQTAVT